MISKPRKGWVAGIISLISPGLGQVYNGQMGKGFIILLVNYLFLRLLLIPIALPILGTSKFLPGLIALIIFVLVFDFAVMADAVLVARSYKEEYQLKKYNNIIVYIGIYVLGAITTTLVGTFIKSNYVQAFKIPAGSMEQTLLIGDHILVDRRLSSRDPNRGTLIIFEYPEDATKDFVKRVVAVGGDTVEIRDKQLFINGTPVKESFVSHKESETIPSNQNKRDNFGPVTVPSNSYFVMGDNRDRSYDSRFWGFVEKSKIKGTVKNIYWSWDKEKSGVRWSRIGSVVQ